LSRAQHFGRGIHEILVEVDVRALRCRCRHAASIHLLTTRVYTPIGSTWERRHDRHLLRAALRRQLDMGSHRDQVSPGDIDVLLHAGHLLALRPGHPPEHDRRTSPAEGTQTGATDVQRHQLHVSIES
jgi:hypothetical protein